MRARIELSGEWQFWPDISGRFATRSPTRDFLSAERLERSLGVPRTIHVPGAWQAQFADLRLWWGTSFYRRYADIPARWSDRRSRLCFGAVDYYCLVWVNGEAAGSHEGGYLPFDFDVTDLVDCGTLNEILVEVRDPGPGTSTGSAAPFDFREIPHGKQSWYGPLGGIWQDVYVEATAPAYIAGAGINADPSTGELIVDATVAGTVPQAQVIACDVFSPAGQAALQGSVRVPAVEGRSVVRATVGDITTWEPNDPALYRVRLRLEDARGVSDEWTDEFGFRSIRAESGRILLNDHPLYLRGALDQDYYAGTICTPPSNDLLRRQIVTAKELGLNLLRCHIKVPDPRYLRWADRLGMLVWLELPCWQRLTAAARRRALTTLAGMIERDGNRPSVIAWTIVNESWGIDLSDREQRAWLEETFEWVKGADPTRLVVDNSACASNFHIKSDLNDFHYYRALPDHADEWRRWTAEWTGTPGSTYSPHGDQHRTGTEPLVLSEFGNWGLPDLDGLLDEAGREPWWFETGRGWDDGAVWPEGALGRFEAWRLDDVFGSWSGLAAAAQELQHDAMKYEIEDVRRYPSLAGYVITEFTDVHWECNGLLDLARKPKAYHGRFKDINGPDAVVLIPDKRRYWSGEIATVEAFLSHYSGVDLRDAEMRLTIGEWDDAHAVRLEHLQRGHVHAAGQIHLKLPKVEHPEAVKVTATLVTAEGSTVARNEFRMIVLPRRESEHGSPVGERIGNVLIADSFTDAEAEWLKDGGKALLLVAEPDALTGTGSLDAIAREGTKWQGDWAQGLHWLHPRVVGDVPIPHHLSMEWAGLVPRHVLVGYEPSHASDVLSGYFVGWVRHPVATTGGFRHGAGAAIVTTFPLLERPDDPLALWLRERLLNIVSDPSFSPGRVV